MAFCCTFMSALSQVDDTIYIDLGSDATMTSDGWNNLTLQRTGSISDLINISGINTGIAVSVTDAFNGVNTSGMVADPSLDIPSSAAGDSFFGNTVDWSGAIEPSGGITFSNLDISTPYSFTIFASREASDNRETKYTVSGSSTVEILLDAAGNTSNLAVVNDLLPASNGTISIIASPGENNTNSYQFFYMGVVKVFFENSYIPPVPELKLTYPVGGELMEEGKTKTIKWESKSVSEIDIEYSADSGVVWENVASSVSGSNQKFEWTIPSTVSGNCLLRIFDAANHSLGDTCDAVFSIVANDGLDYHIVVLGSSTAAGQGPSVKDSAWVWMYTEYLNMISTNFQLTNLAVGGFTTYNILPTGYAIPPGIGKPVDPAHNITKALSLHPDALIINLPSNDAANNFPVIDQLANYDTIAKLAASFLVPLWICTPQPKYFGAAQDQIQLDMVDSTYSIFKDKTIDFWEDMVEEDGSNDLKDIYDSGDGTHVNNTGHKVLLERVIDADIPTYISNLPTNYFTVPEANVAIGYEQGSNGKFNIISDLAWTVSTDVDWLDLSNTSGSGNGELIVTASSENASESPRVANMTFSPEGLSDVLVTATQVVIELYTLTVINGTGSGEYAEGTIVDVVADPDGFDKIFFSWTGDVDHLNDITLSSAQLTMPVSDISITASYSPTSVIAVNSTLVSLYPNPVSDRLNIQLSGQFEGCINLYSVSGSHLLKKYISKEIETIYTGKLGKGIYIVEIIDASGNNVYRGRFSKF